MKKINLLKDDAEKIHKELSKRLPEFCVKSINKTKNDLFQRTNLCIEINIECAQHYNLPMKNDD